MVTLSRRILPCLASIRNTFRLLPTRGVTMDDDGDTNPGTTTVQILNKVQDQGIFFEAYSPLGFLLSSGIRVMGPCAVFPKSILHWNVKNALDINEDSLSLFTILEPRIDLLLLGVGERENLARVNNTNIILYLRSKRVNVEILTTDQAVATFNFLNSEKRYVAAALIPPSYVEEDEDGMHSNEDYTIRSDIFEDPEVNEEELKQVYAAPRKAMERLGLGQVLPGQGVGKYKDEHGDKH